MSSSTTVCGIDPEDKSWLRREVQQTGLSTEEFVRHPSHEKRTNTGCQPKPLEAFARHFGMEHGVELPLPAHLGYRLPPFSGKDWR